MKNLDRLQHILDAIDEVAEQVAKGRKVFDADKLVSVFIKYQLQVIGEACSRLPKELLADHPEVPWRQVIGMRHMLVHGYDQVDPGIVWNVATNELSQLRAQIAAMVDAAQ